MDVVHFTAIVLLVIVNTQQRMSMCRKFILINEYLLSYILIDADIYWNSS